MLSFIAIGFIAVVCYVAASKEVFFLKGDQTSNSIWPFETPDRNVSSSKTGIQTFQLMPDFKWMWTPATYSADGPISYAEFVLDLNGQAGCKLKSGDYYFLQIISGSYSYLVVIDKKMKYSVEYSADYLRYDPNKERNISVGLWGDLNCPKSDTFALIQAGFIDPDNRKEVPYGGASNCRGGANDYLKGSLATDFVVKRKECKVGKDVISGDDWPKEIIDPQAKTFGLNVIVCRLHPSICVHYKRSIDDDSKFELQNMEVENKKLQEHNRGLENSKGNGGLDSSDKNNESSSPNRRRSSSSGGRRLITAIE